MKTREEIEAKIKNWKMRSSGQKINVIFILIRGKMFRNFMLR